jgi:tryptophanyl-tRNA synthetase
MLRDENAELRKSMASVDAGYTRFKNEFFDLWRESVNVSRELREEVRGLRSDINRVMQERDDE